MTPAQLAAAIADPAPFDTFDQETVRLEFALWLAKRCLKWRCTESQIIAALLEPQPATAAPEAPSVATDANIGGENVDGDPAEILDARADAIGSDVGAVAPVPETLPGATPPGDTAASGEPAGATLPAPIQPIDLPNPLRPFDPMRVKPVEHLPAQPPIPGAGYAPQGADRSTEGHPPDPAPANTPREASGTARKAPGVQPTAEADIGAPSGPQVAPRHDSQAKASEGKAEVTSAGRGPDGDASRLSVGSGTDAPIQADVHFSALDGGVENEQATHEPHEAAIAEPAIPVAGSAPVPPRLTLVQRIAPVLAEHPDWSIRQIAQAIDAPHGSVAATISVNKMRPPKTSHLNLTRSLADVGIAEAAPDRASSPVEAPEADPAPEAQPDRPSQAAASPEAAATPEPPAPRLSNAERAEQLKSEARGRLNGHSVEPAPESAPVEGFTTLFPVKRPRGNRVMLRTGNGEGAFVHQSLTLDASGRLATVPSHKGAWIGNRDQLKAVRGKFPEAAKFYPVEAPK